MAFKVFLDTNIFLDHFLQRNEHSSKLLTLCEETAVRGYASSASFYTMAYLLGKNLSHQKARTILSQFIRFITIVPTSKENLDQAFSSGFTDLEDAFQYFTALHDTSLDYFLTHNIKDFRAAISSLPVVTPKVFLRKHFPEHSR